MKRICLSCDKCPCDWLTEQVEAIGAPIIAWSGACERWRMDSELRGIRREVKEAMRIGGKP